MKSKDLAADNVCTESPRWAVPLSFCEGVEEEGLYSLLGLRAESFGYPGRRGSTSPIYPVPWSKTSVGWLSGWSHNVFPI